MTFSIITATYNVGDSLRRTLDSVLNQTYNPDKIEMVIIDGGSTDNTVDIIKEYEPLFNGRLSWLSEKDEGIYHAFNKGIKKAKHEIVNFKGAGDWLEHNALELVAEAFEQAPQTDIMHGMLAIWRENKLGHLIPVSVGKPLEPASVWETHNLEHPAYFYHKRLHEKYGFYDQKYGIVSDLKFFLQVTAPSQAVWGVIHEVLANFVVGGVSSVVRRATNEREMLIAELLPTSGFSLLKIKHIQLLTLARGVNSRWVVGDYYEGWKDMSVIEKQHLIVEAQEWIKINKIDRQMIELFERTVWRYEGRPQPHMVEKAIRWVEAIMNETDTTTLIEVFDKFNTSSPNKIKLKAIIKNCLPYGVARLIQKRK